MFKCPVNGCAKTFNEKGILKTHMRIHTGDRPYKCTFIGCKEQYSTKSILTEHLKKVHKEESDDDSSSIDGEEEHRSIMSHSGAHEPASKSRGSQNL